MLFAALFTATLFIAPALADFTVATPVLTQCQPVTVTYNGGSGPYNALISDAGSPCDQFLQDLGDSNGGGSFSPSPVQIAAGKQVVISVQDSTGEEAWTGTVTVGPSGDSSCLPATTGSNTGSQQSATTPSTTPATGGTTTGSTTGSTTGGSTGGSTTGSTTSSNTDGAPVAIAAAAKNPVIGNGAAGLKAQGSITVLAALGAIFAMLL
jgi:hypothetical protein